MPGILQADNPYLHGMFQSERYFDSTADLLRLHFSFRYPPQPAVAELPQEIQSGPSIALHFRLGDYQRNPEFARSIGSLDFEYYHRALTMLRQRSPNAKVYLFSDEIETVAESFQLSGPHEYVRVVRPFHAYDKIRLMAACDHIAVANRTFSWWAAWLNQNPEKLVIAPDPWFVN
ncbi:MAG: alpha-1,2-fucosyltransferase [Candidatus Synoicihabitans palmerolidicus]|nr:alpha-1,2-fucosyltransferase [Candidatus Synoicihabitans palmerolidicus]